MLSIEPRDRCSEVDRPEASGRGFVILGAIFSGVSAGFAPIAIDLGLTLIYQTLIPVTNSSVIPVHSIGVVLFTDGPAQAQFWLFSVAPLIGGAIGVR